MKLIEKTLYLFSALALLLFIMNSFDSEYLTSFLSALVGLTTLMVAKAANSSSKSANEFIKSAHEKEERRDLPFIAPMFHQAELQTREYRNNHNTVSYIPTGSENRVYIGIRNIGKGTAIDINFINGIESHPGISFLEPDKSWPLGDVLSNNNIPTGQTFQVSTHEIPPVGNFKEFSISYSGVLGEVITTSFNITHNNNNTLTISNIRKNANF
jgi:hypothetical protein